jgi:hypothetical protein
MAARDAVDSNGVERNLGPWDWVQLSSRIETCDDLHLDFL